MSVTVELSRRLITEQVLARLVTGLAPSPVYDAELFDPATGQSVQAPVITDVDGNPDPSGRVARYAVLFPLPGGPSGEVDLADTHLDLRLTYQVNAVAGWRADCEAHIDAIHALLYRWSPTVEGYECGWLRPPTGYQPGAIRRVDAERPAPPRFWLPLQYQLRVTR